MSTPKPELVVGVGASAGGLEAFRHLLDVLPSDTGMCFLLVQHLDPTHESILSNLLVPHTTMPVVDADQGTLLEPDTVYVIRPDTALGVRQDRIELTSPTLHRGVRLPVDYLFRSLGREYGPRAVGIVLSGAGSDGSVGIRDVKAGGGLVIAQSPQSCRHPGMPQSLIDTGMVDLVLEIDQIPKALARFAELPPRARAELPDSGSSGFIPSLDETDLEQLATVLDSQRNFDLRVYKAGTIQRRMIRRMAMANFEEVDAYLEYIRSDSAEQQALIRDLLISVTDFFRDPQAFDALRASVIDPLVAEAGDTLRAWVPGCATGEEAYSLAIEFLESMRAQDKRVALQIFATDVDQDALSIARTAVYPPSIADRISPERLETYFERLEGRGYRVRSMLRDTLSFAMHDLTKDPPFSRMGLVSCRNVLIYLTPEAQRRVLKVLHFALNPSGYLFLSTSESTGPQRELFTTVSKSQRIYKKFGASRPMALLRSRRQVEGKGGGTTGIERPREGRRPLGRGDHARRAVLQALAPPTIVVAENGSMVFTHGELSPYLRIPQGDEPQLDLSTVLRPEIATRTRGVLYKCRRNQEVVSALSSPDGSAGQVCITAYPASNLGESTVILTFEDAENDDDDDERSGALGPSASPDHEAVIDELERELQATREDLRNTVEELESSNEELRSSNEESMSMNEELQSANEELEATTEELRSLNEELTTVNLQLREKVEQLEQAHDDLHNFFASTKIATVFLDDQLCIKRFTPAARKVLGIDHADTGRYIGDIARELLQSDLDEDVRSVLEHFSSRTREIRTSDRRWFSREVLPYRTESRRIEGVVVTFVDITELKSATERLGLRGHQQGVVARIGLLALRESNLQTFMDQVVRDVQQALGSDLCRVMELQPGHKTLLVRAGVGWTDGVVGSATESGGVGSLAGYALQFQEPVVIEDLEEDERISSARLLVDHHVVSGMSCAVYDDDAHYGVLDVFTRYQRSFGAQDAHFLQAVAIIVGSAIGRYQGRMRLALELGVAHVLSEASDLDETLDQVLGRMAVEQDSAVAELWWREEGNVLRRRSLFVSPPLDYGDVEAHFSHHAFTPGEGLVGRVLESHHAQWATDLGDARLFVRSEGAAKLGLASAVGFPVHAGTELLGVIVLFSTERLFADESHLRSLEGIGRSIGDYVARWRSDGVARELAAITESSHDGIVSYRTDGTVTQWLPGAEELFGYSAEEMVGRSIEQLVPEELRSELWAVNDRIERGEVIEPFETTRRCKDGRLLEVSIRSSPIKDREGRVVGISSTDRDITRLKETERRLIEADRHKDEFLAMLGHELRNPVAAIRSAASLLPTEGDDVRLVRIQSVLRRQSAHIAKLLDGLLDVSRIVRGKIELEVERVDFASICQEVLSDHEGRLGERARMMGLHVVASPVWVEGDPVRLVQIVDNLLTNAINYTPEGGHIELRLSVDGGVVELRVRDDGVGIEPELLPHVFETFRQSKQSLDRSYGGLGLGLTLVRSLVALHGGDVEAHSEGRGQGSEFVVRLPEATQAGADAPAADDGDSALRVLVIEDNEDSAEMLEEVLELSGHRVWVALRAQLGLDLAREHVPDVVVCDIGLPGGITGYDVARQLRADPKTRDIPLVALTGYGRSEDEERSLEAGFDIHLTKPVEMARIFNMLERVRLGELRSRSKS